MSETPKPENSVEVLLSAAPLNKVARRQFISWPSRAAVCAPARHLDRRTVYSGHPMRCCIRLRSWPPKTNPPHGGGKVQSLGMIGFYNTALFREDSIVKCGRGSHCEQQLREDSHVRIEVNNSSITVK